MGCGVSTPEGASVVDKLNAQPKLDEPRGNRRKGTGTSVKSTEEPKKLNGKEKYILEAGSLICEIEDRRRTGIPQCYVIVYGNATSIGFTLLPTTAATTSSSVAEYYYGKELTDEALREAKDQQRVTHTWAALFKSVASEITKGRVKVVSNTTVGGQSAQEVRLEFAITSSKDPKSVQTFSVLLAYKPITNVASMAPMIFLPLLQYIKKRKATSEANLETEITVKTATLASAKRALDAIAPELRSVRETVAVMTKVCTESHGKITTLERHMRRLRTPVGTERHVLNRLYNSGGAIAFQHVSYAEEHIPKEIPPHEGILDLIRTRLPATSPDVNVASLFVQPSLTSHIPPEALAIFHRLDEWDFDVFDLDSITNGASLFHVTFAVLYRWNLVSIFNLDEKVIRRFLCSVQAGYYKNSYHNSTHAADVTQIMSFILGPGGLSRHTNLPLEDILAAVLAASIHDYNHPGFNNNFHTRTGAYLSTLYNDRSILENHHLACTFEMMRLPEYDVLAPLSTEKRKDVRDTMIEMVLSTDMGNHAKIFSQFRKRLSENSDWSQRTEDRRLALSMAIKMADISNCGRPSKLYRQWARNLANEFYNQGDIEARLNLPISPFMDRRKDSTEFKKGQISFMNYIVLPMFDAIIEFLPNLEFVLGHCTANKEYWQNKDG